MGNFLLDKLLGPMIHSHAGLVPGPHTHVVADITDYPATPMIFIDSIAVAADFPTVAAVETGWFFIVTAGVTDNDVTKTNTGQAFVANDEIVWNGTDWTLMGNSTVFTSRHTVFVDKNGNDTTGNGSFAKPYLTIQKAVDEVANLPAQASVQRFNVIVGPGTYDEDVVWTLVDDWGLGAVEIQASFIGFSHARGSSVVVINGSFELVHHGGALAVNMAFAGLRFVGAVASANDFAFQYTEAGGVANFMGLRFHNCRFDAGQAYALRQDSTSPGAGTVTVEVDRCDVLSTGLAANTGQTYLPRAALVASLSTFSANGAIAILLDGVSAANVARCFISTVGAAGNFDGIRHTGPTGAGSAILLVESAAQLGGNGHLANYLGAFSDPDGYITAGSVGVFTSGTGGLSAAGGGQVRHRDAVGPDGFALPVTVTTPTLEILLGDIAEYNYDNSLSALAAVRAKEAIDELALTSQRLAMAADIDLETVAQTAVFTVPAGKTAVITGLDVIIQTASGASVTPEIQLGTTAAPTELVAPVALNAALLAAGKLERFEFVSDPYAAGTVIEFGIDVIGVATGGYTARAVVHYYLI